MRFAAPWPHLSLISVIDIFLVAVEKAPAERATYLDAACGPDAGLRAQVEALLRSHEEAGSLLEQPLFRPIPTVDEPPAPIHPLFALPNVTLTPHSAGPTWENWAARFRNGFDNIQRVAAGDRPRWVIPELA